MDDWKSIKVDGVTKIEKIVAEFNVWAIQKLPFPKFKVKIKEISTGGFSGSTNVAVRSLLDNEPEWTIGFGNTITESLEDTIKSFFETIEGMEETSLSEDDFVWSDPHDF
ncbi:hypothetical protein PAECIP111893_04944 [Paenibacillus plantiphilus]|uniref:Uncharacterized protein n=1 Tax=Paenibacillus plantiphilus TaxID=2905650 RepID=A0ABM9CV75_9BACL|nr:hypothetical protein [Paenibacillus plantiphilus]CAH1223278.1 hypothetical protein PAECIP111893_04944 [Paenibacillus plantiphilus]